MNPSIILDAIHKDLKRLRAEIEYLKRGEWSDAARTYAKITVAKAQIEILDEYRAFLENTSDLTQMEINRLAEGGAK